jgi:hypothetical protein
MRFFRSPSSPISSATATPRVFPIARRGERGIRKGRMITNIMTGFFEELSEVIMLVIIRHGFH